MQGRTGLTVDDESESKTEETVVTYFKVLIPVSQSLDY
jgi:hypothetical protein